MHIASCFVTRVALEWKDRRMKKEKFIKVCGEREKNDDEFCFLPTNALHRN